MNNVSLAGRLTREPDVRQFGEATVSRFTLAVDRRYKKDGEQTADFINCVAFGSTAGFVEKYFYKGMWMGLNGRIQTGSYTNKEGVKVYTTDVIADNVEFVESKKDSGGGQNENKRSDDGFMNIPDGIDEELPFN